MPKILIVDDTSEDRDVLRGLLEPHATLYLAKDGAQAIKLARKRLPDLILLDIMMPGMDGYEICQRLKENEDTMNVPVIFVTAMGEMEDESRGFEVGGVDYITKPIRAPIVLARVKTHVELYRQKEALRKKNRELDGYLFELEVLQKELREANEQLRQLSVIDGLTGLLNRRRFDEILTEEWQRCVRNKESLALLMIDIDHFKPYNDTYGHLRGDTALKRVANALASSPLRHIDRVARYGGEEFVVILPGTTLEGAMQMAEKMRLSVLDLSIEHTASSTGDHLSISVGVAATIPNVRQSYLELIESADSALYDAKEKGRNCSTGSIGSNALQ